jgi:thermostable 8-oxoguanine DNA glycosylase
MLQPVQTAYAVADGKTLKLDLPASNAEVLPGVFWGALDEVGTAAYWGVHAWHHQRLGTYNDLRLGRVLGEELTACLLGGYGMPADIALAAYRRLRAEGLIRTGVSQLELEEALSKPFTIHGQPRRYRFAKQKSGYLARCLQRLESFQVEERSDVGLRDGLAEFPGIGPKTASWIVRNYRDSDDVAILDVHIVRAGRMIGIFDSKADPQRNYRCLEAGFLRLAKALGVRAALLDALIWDHMRRISHALPRDVPRSGAQLRGRPSQRSGSYGFDPALRA